MSQESRPVQEFEISDALWGRIEPLLPVRAKPVHPLGRHRQRVPDRRVLNSIFSLLSTGGQWKSLDSLDAARYAKSSTAHARFQEWMEAGFFARLWEASLLEYDERHGLNFEWMALDGAMTKAPLGGGKSSPLTEAAGIVVGLVVEGANRHDRKLVRETLESEPAIIAAKRDDSSLARSRWTWRWNWRGFGTRSGSRTWKLPCPSRGCVWMPALTMTRCARWPLSEAAPPTSSRAVRRNKPKSLVKRRGAGWASALTPGSMPPRGTRPPPHSLGQKSRQLPRSLAVRVCPHQLE